MLEKFYDTVVLGGGAAGMAAAVEIAVAGFRVAIVEREDELGGILLQCIHNGFGLHRFKQELTGPEYAQRFIDQIRRLPIDVYLNSAAVEITPSAENKTIIVYSGRHGVMKLATRSIVLAMGCRERNRGNLGIPGTRPAGIFTAGLAQRLVNIDGYLPGKDIVIVGSGDIGLIMARRMSWTGARVHAVIEIMPHPSGLTRNIVQCLNDFNIPLYLSHVVSRINGKDRVESVEVTPLVDGVPDTAGRFIINCDTVLLSVGLIPENELSKRAGVTLSPDTNGPVVNANLMTAANGIFACGNVLHVHDLVDYVSDEASRCGRYVCQYLNGALPEKSQGSVRAGRNVKYVLPNRYNPDRENTFYLRPLIVKNDVVCRVLGDGQELKTLKLRHVQPSEMINLTVDALPGKPETLEIEIE